MAENVLQNVIASDWTEEITSDVRSDGGPYLDQGLVRVGDKTPIAAPTAVDSLTGTAYTLDISDANKHLRFSAASLVSVNVPAQVDVDWQADTEIYFEQVGVGAVQLDAESGVTIRSSLSTKTKSQWSVIWLKRVGLNEWLCGGERDTTNSLSWLLITYIWDDEGVWDDTATWNE